MSAISGRGGERGREQGERRAVLHAFGSLPALAGAVATGQEFLVVLASGDRWVPWLSAAIGMKCLWESELSDESDLHPTSSQPAGPGEQGATGDWTPSGSSRQLSCT